MATVLKDETKKAKRQARRQSRRKERQARRPGIFAQLKDERQQHRQNAGPLRRIAGTVIPAAHLTYLLKDLGNKK